MNEIENLATEKLWKIVEESGQDAQNHVNWIDYLEVIRVCCALIDSRIQSFERKARAEKLLKNSSLVQKRAREISEKEEVKG